VHLLQNNRQKAYKPYHHHKKVKDLSKVFSIANRKNRDINLSTQDKRHKRKVKKKSPEHLLPTGITRMELVAFRGDKPKMIARLQRPLKSVPPPTIFLSDLSRNPDKVILYENKSPMFFQVYYYKSKPHTLAIVCGNRVIAFPFDYAFIVKKACEDYIEQLPHFNWKGRKGRDEYVNKS